MYKKNILILVLFLSGFMFKAKSNEVVFLRKNIPDHCFYLDHYSVESRKYTVENIDRSAFKRFLEGQYDITGFRLLIINRFKKFFALDDIWDCENSYIEKISILI